MTEAQKNSIRGLALLVVTALAAWGAGWLHARGQLGSPSVAAWVQAIGSLAAIWTAVLVSAQQARRENDREERAQSGKRQAALGLAQMAAARLKTISDIAADPARRNLLYPTITLTSDLTQMQGILTSFPMAELTSIPLVQAFGNTIVQMNFAVRALQPLLVSAKLEDLDPPTLAGVMNSLRQTAEYADAAVQQMSREIIAP